jgi:hypothetical protein
MGDERLRRMPRSPTGTASVTEWTGTGRRPMRHHLDPLSNDRVGLTLQRLFQALYLVLVALDHPLPLANRQMVVTNHIEGANSVMPGRASWTSWRGLLV